MRIKQYSNHEDCELLELDQFVHKYLREKVFDWDRIDQYEIQKRYYSTVY